MLEDAYARGRVAYRKGRQLDDCPYQDHDGRDWRCGWRDARDFWGCTISAGSSWWTLENMAQVTV